MIYNVTRDNHVAYEPCWARSWWMRTRGMIGRDFASENFDAMIFENCSSLHSCFMSSVLDVVFVNREGKVVKTFSAFRPWRVLFGGRGAVTAIELPQGQIAKCMVQTGDILNLNSNLSPEEVEIFRRRVILNKSLFSDTANEVPGRLLNK